MNITEKFIRDLIDKGESEQLELSLQGHLDSIAKTVCGFLNTSGGYIIVGVKDSGEIVGLPDTNSVENIDKYIYNYIVPQSIVTVSKEVVENKEVVLIEVLTGSKQPYIYDGSIFYRVEGKTEKATSSQVSDLINKRIESDFHWERQITLGLEYSELDDSEVNKSVKSFNDSGRSSVNSFDQLGFLSYLGLYQNSSFTNAATVLFARQPTIYFPQCRIRVISFPTSKAGSTINYDDFSDGNIFKNIEFVQRFFDSQIKLSSELSHNEWFRLDQSRFPKRALREGLINAMVHRDYSNSSGGVTVSLFPDRLEIANYGELPKEITVSDLKKTHFSYPRNPDIAHVCYLRGLVEKIGSGTLKIIEDCRKSGLKDPKWISKSGTTTLIFYSRLTYGESARIEVSQLNERQIKIINVVLPGDSISVVDYLHYIEIPLTDRSARNDLILIVEGGWFIKQGSGRNTRYFRTNKKLE